MLLGFSIAMMGCSFGKAEITKDTVTIEKNGKVTETLVDVFDRDYYNLPELEEMAKEEIQMYNATVGDHKVTYLSGSEGDDRTVQMKLEYSDPDCYAEFNDTSFFYGTVTEAYKAGCGLDLELHDAKDESQQIGLDDLLGMGNRHMLWMEQDSNVVLPSDIIYVSQNVTSVDGKQADVNYDGNPVVIICK